MTYSAQERTHDEALIRNLTDAKFIEESYDGDIFIRLAHLTGRISFGDGVMTWAILGMDIGGSKPVDQRDINGSAAYLTNYARKALRNEMDNVARKVIASAQGRVAA